MRLAFLLRAAFASVGALTLAGTAHAFAFLGSIWPDGNIEMHLQLGAPASPLSDGAADWAAVAEAALNEWNPNLGRVKFTTVRNSTAAIAEGNRINNVIFRPNFYGRAFDENTLAVTLAGGSGAPNDRDVIFNSNLQWDSYRGALRPNVFDFRRVALHEFGHVLGLDHPDAPDDSSFAGSRTAQTGVGAIMRSRISGGIENLRADDIDGVKLLYQRPPSGTFAQTRSLEVEAGNGSVTIGITPGGDGPWRYFYYFRPTDSNRIEEFAFATGANYTIGSVQLADAGTFIATATSERSGAFFSSVTTLGVTPAVTRTDTTLGNLSTRGVVGTGNNVLIAGFVIGGATPKPVLVRAVGPALADFGVGGPLADPTLTILNSAGQNVAQNDNWEAGGNAIGLTAAAARLNAFPFKPGSLDSAVLTTLPPGNYSVVVSGVNDSTGVSLVEVYDADVDAAASRSHRLVNIATRGHVSAGENTLIAGLIVAGPGPRTYLIRAIGPTLLGAPFNITTALRDPVLQIYRGDQLLRENDDIDAPNTSLTTLRDAARQVGAFTLREQRIRQTSTNPGSGLDAAMLITLQPGAYTAKVIGFEGSTGVALVEIYEMP
jgi:hypothetical protein